MSSPMWTAAAAGQRWPQGQGRRVGRQISQVHPHIDCPSQPPHNGLHKINKCGKAHYYIVFLSFKYKFYKMLLRRRRTNKLINKPPAASTVMSTTRSSDSRMSIYVCRPRSFKSPFTLTPPTNALKQTLRSTETLSACCNKYAGTWMWFIFCWAEDKQNLDIL